MLFALSLSACQNADPPRKVTATGTPSFQTATATLEISIPGTATPAMEWVLLNQSPHAGSFDCNVCHESSGTTISSPIAWWNQESGQYEPVADSNALCGQCHHDIETLRQRVGTKDAVHTGFECTSCHNPHSTVALCSQSGCHETVRPESVIPPATPSGGLHPNVGASFCGGPNCHPAATQAALSSNSIHGATHSSVSCSACHDASGMQVGPSKELGTWVPLRTTEVGGVAIARPYESHDIQTKVDCSRCHFEGNEWGLPSVTGNEFGY
jgi:hypothetical protein